ncbi:hypothetical protein [Spirochaeta lutea]|uniref:RCK C-terminal domain-containing protein n=1 Tax=Spirochaeta lutea TaxID=1480694 RepID=A0A098QRZ8_9SPIO|nr:hypothetical protein [Spirochaeta lutea]KGE70640.1 hypothetical protein DC28_14070 [Spirochaeta lutea]
MGKLLAAYLLEPASETISRQIIQSGGIDLMLWELGTQEVSTLGRVSNLSKQLYLQGGCFVGLYRNGRPLINPPGTMALEPRDRAILLTQV